jgi:isopenicillin N synthase-like dioxygenase
MALAPEPADGLPSPPSIPVVDIAAWVARDRHDDAARAATAACWNEAMTESGFAMVAGHGVDQQLIEAMLGGARAFFEQDREAKMQYNHGPYGNSSGGYTSQGVESVSRAGTMSDGSAAAAPADLVENYVLRGRPEQWGAAPGTPGLPAEGPLPAHAPQLADVAQRYHRELERVLTALNDMSAAALGLEPGFFARFHAPADCSLRLAHYPPIGEAEDGAVAAGALRYGAHSDYQGFTILLQDPADEGKADAGGLEVQARTAAATAAGTAVGAGSGWLPVTPQPGCFVVNIGDLHEVWTNGRWRSTVHRVSNPPPGSPARQQSRYSIPFFTGPSGESIIEVLPTCVDEEDAGHPAAQWSPISAKEHLLSKLATSNL